MFLICNADNWIHMGTHTSSLQGSSCATQRGRISPAPTQTLCCQKGPAMTLGKVIESLVPWAPSACKAEVAEHPSSHPCPDGKYIRACELLI